MRILHLVHQYPPQHVGGTELYTQALAQDQVARGHDVTIMYPSNNDAARIDEAGVTIRPISVNSRSRTAVFLHTLRQPTIEDAITAFLDDSRPDLVHVQHLMGIPASAMTAIKQRGIPYVITLHDYWYGCANAQLITNTDQTICAGPDRNAHNCARCALARAGLRAHGLTAAAVAPVLRRRNALLATVLRNAAAVIAPTRFVRDIYKEMGLPTANIVVIAHGIDVPTDLVAAARAQHSARLQDGVLRIGFVGSVAHLKGLHVLIDAVNRLPADKVALTVYGGLDTFPDYVAELRQQIVHDNIRLAGRIARDALWAAIATKDVFVMPTLWYEASPLTIQELFAVGVPIVASNIGAMPEKIRDGVDGLLFPPGDAQALALILETLLQDRSVLTRLEQAIEPVRSIADQSAEIEHLYTTII